MKKNCPVCIEKGDVAKMDAGTDFDFAPIWKCRLCWHEMPRRVLNTKNKRERAAETERLIKKYNLLDEVSQ